jgi:7,8-dihydroneopterin aldolase/epimerase/oxygenase
MTDKVGLRTIRLHGHHGVSPAERRQGQIFEVDLELEYDTRPAAATDDLTLTVDYSAVYEDVARIVTTEQYQLIETLADRIAQAILSRWPVVEGVTVQVRKPEVKLPGPVGHSFVQIHRTAR